MSNFKASSFVIALASVVAAGGGCVPLLEESRRALTPGVPTSFSAPVPVLAPVSGSVVDRVTTASPPPMDWSEFFGSPALRTLIELALQQNQELSIQTQELIVARSEVSARQGEFLPRLRAGAGLGAEKVGRYTSQGANDEALDLPAILGDFRFGLTGSWEVDIWRRLRSAADAADRRYQASVEARHFFVTQLVAEISRSYYELLAIDNRLEVLTRNIAIQTDALAVVKVQKQAARVSELAVQRFEAEVLKNRSRLYRLEQERVQVENRINLLVGRYPQPVHPDAQEFQQPLPTVPHAGLPSQLLDHRPDVRQASLELKAAQLDVESARAAFLPALTIDAGLGYRSFNPGHLVDTPDSLTFGIGGSLSVPLLNRQGIEAQYRSADARQVQAVVGYEKTLLQAFTDVATQLARLQNLQKSYELQSRQVEALVRSVDASLALFQSARADYMEVLLMRRDSLDAQLELIETRQRQLLATVSLYQALGGGWGPAREGVMAH